MENNNLNLPAQLLPQSPVSKKWYQHKGFITVFVLAVIAAVAIWVYFILNQPQDLEPIAIHHQQAQTPTQSAASNWKTYTNSEFGFQFQYPNNWTPGDALELNNYGDKGLSFTGIFAVSNQIPATDQYGDPMIDTPEFNIAIENLSGVSSQSLSQQMAKQSNYNLGDLTATRYVEDGSETISTRIEFMRNGKLLRITYAWSAVSGHGQLDSNAAANKQQMLDIFNKILSTFQFSNQIQPSVTSATPTSTQSASDAMRQQGLDLNTKIHLLTPQNGSSLCIGQQVDIKWQVPSDMVAVSLEAVTADDQPPIYNLGTFPASYKSPKNDGSGDYVWTVGTNIPPNAAYHIVLKGTYQGWALYTYSPGSFAINDCLNSNAPKY